jgi:hypothetical protein
LPRREPTEAGLKRLKDERRQANGFGQNPAPGGKKEFATELLLIS